MATFLFFFFPLSLVRAHIAETTATQRSNPVLILANLGQEFCQN